MAIIPQCIVASNLLWLTVDSRCSLGFFFIASHIHFFTLTMPLHSQVPLILPLLPAYLGSFKLVGSYYILYILTGYNFLNITFIHASSFSVFVNIRGVNRCGRQTMKSIFSFKTYAWDMKIFDRMAYAHFKSTEAALTYHNSTAE